MLGKLLAYANKLLAYANNCEPKMLAYANIKSHAAKS